MTTWNHGIPGPAWDDQLFAAGGHFLQSSHWAAFQQALGRQVFYAQGEGWQCLAILEKSRLAPRVYAPYGPFLTHKDGLQPALQALTSLAVHHKAIFARIEPTGAVSPTELTHHHLKPALKDIQQHLTWVLDLTKPADDILAAMSATNRNLYRTYTKKGISLRASDQPWDMQAFLDMTHEVAAHTGITPHADSYYQTMAEVLFPRGAAHLYIAELDGQPIASAFVFDSPTTRYYAHAGSFSEYRKLHAGAPLLAHMIFEAQTRGQTQFDFCGVAPPDAPSTHRWAGFTKFKQSFGGDYKWYTGTWELPVNRLAYNMYRSAYHVHKILR